MFSKEKYSLNWLLKTNNNLMFEQQIVENVYKSLCDPPPGGRPKKKIINMTEIQQWKFKLLLCNTLATKDPKMVVMSSFDLGWKLDLCSLILHFSHISWPNLRMPLDFPFGLLCIAVKCRELQWLFNQSYTCWKWTADSILWFSSIVTPTNASVT